MATPPYRYGRYTPVLLSNLQQILAFPAQNGVSNYLHQPIHTFTNPMPYHYFLHPHHLYPPPHNYPYNVAVSPGTAPASQPQPQTACRPSQKGPKMKKQRKPSENGAKFVNLVSDQQEPAQSQKAVFEKSTTSNSKVNEEFNQPQQQKIIDNQIIAEKQQLEDKNAQKKTEKSKPLQKTAKKVQTVKHRPLKKKTKPSSQTSIQIAIKKGLAHSQRIIEKQSVKKEPFRLSKRDRQDLQLGELRELQTGILTGPQFQVKLPQVIEKGRSDWLKNIRDDLLQRKYRGESDQE